MKAMPLQCKLKVEQTKLQDRALKLDENVTDKQKVLNTPPQRGKYTVIKGMIIKERI